MGIPEGCFLSALQPNSSCTTYVVPSDGPSPDPVAKARRVREQVRMRLAERKSSSLSRLEGSTGESLKAAQSNGKVSKVHSGQWSICYLLLELTNTSLSSLPPPESSGQGRFQDFFSLGPQGPPQKHVMSWL